MSQIDITLTERALSNAQRLQAETSSFQDLDLRLYIEGKGCDGFYYGVCFDKKESSDLEQDFENIKLILDEETYYFCKGSTIDWLVHEELGEGFIVDNPRQKKFRGKFYKRKSFQEVFDKRGKASEH